MQLHRRAGASEEVGKLAQSLVRWACADDDVPSPTGHFLCDYECAVEEPLEFDDVTLEGLLTEG